MTDNCTSDTAITKEDQDKIEQLLDNHDHPVYVDHHEPDILFDNLKLIFWKSYRGESRSCYFCCEPAAYYNSQACMYSCEECMYDIENKEIDILAPNDHPVSVKLRELLCDWVDREYWCSTDTQSFFDDYGITANLCYICNTVIEKHPGDEVAIAGTTAIAHLKCIDTGFRNYFFDSDYDDIFASKACDVCGHINDLNSRPKYLSIMSDQEKSKFRQLTQSLNLSETMDYTYIKEYIRSLHPREWVAATRVQGCTFCMQGCTRDNVTLQISSCNTCYQSICDDTIMTDPNNKIKDYLMGVIRNWIGKHYFTQISGELYFGTFGMQYSMCNICKDIMEPQDHLAINDCSVSHLSCAESAGVDAYFTKCLDIIKRSRTLGLQQELTTLRDN